MDVAARDVYLDALLLERLQRKADDVRALMTECKNSWEQCMYLLMARYYGGPMNGFAFEMLARVTPLRYIAKIRDNAFRVEAMLFGQAGLLDGELTDPYSLRMQREYRYLAVAYRLRPMPARLWHFAQMRPAGQPAVRIRQWAALLTQRTALFSQMLETDDVATLRSLLTIDPNQTMSSPSERVGGTIIGTGRDFVDRIIINVWAPILCEYGRSHECPDFSNLAIRLLKALPAERNRIVRRWSEVGIRAHDAAYSQALLQLTNEYCAENHCDKCLFGVHHNTCL